MNETNCVFTHSLKSGTITNRGVYYLNDSVSWNTLRARRKRVFGRIDDMLYSGLQVYFFTLTLSDDYLVAGYDHNLSQSVAYISSLCKHYILNADYGRKNGRLHFHAVGIFKSLAVCPVWLRGFSNIKLLDNITDFNRKNYSYKLARHSYKSNTSGPIFSRSWSQLARLYPTESQYYKNMLDIVDDM